MLLNTIEGIVLPFFRLKGSPFSGDIAIHNRMSVGVRCSEKKIPKKHMTEVHAAGYAMVVVLYAYLR